MWVLLFLCRQPVPLSGPRYWLVTRLDRLMSLIEERRWSVCMLSERFRPGKPPPNAKPVSKALLWVVLQSLCLLGLAEYSLGDPVEEEIPCYRAVVYRLTDSGRDFLSGLRGDIQPRWSDIGAEERPEH